MYYAREIFAHFFFLFKLDSPSDDSFVNEKARVVLLYLDQRRWVFLKTYLALNLEGAVVEVSFFLYGEAVIFEDVCWSPGDTFRIKL